MQNNVTRINNKTIGTLEMLIPRYHMGQKYMTEDEQIQLAMVLGSIDLQTVSRIIDRNHARYLSDHSQRGPNSFYEVVDIARSRKAVIQNA